MRTRVSPLNAHTDFKRRMVLKTKWSNLPVVRADIAHKSDLPSVVKSLFGRWPMAVLEHFYTIQQSGLGSSIEIVARSRNIQTTQTNAQLL